MGVTLDLANAGLNSPGDLFENGIAGIVTEAVVDHLELIKIEIQQGVRFLSVVSSSLECADEALALVVVHL